MQDKGQVEPKNLILSQQETGVCGNEGGQGGKNINIKSVPFGKHSEDGHAAASDACSDGCPAVGRQKYGLHGIAVHEIDDCISRQYSAEHGGNSYYRQNQPDQSDSFDTQYLGIDKDQCQVQDGD